MKGSKQELPDNSKAPEKAPEDGPQVDAGPTPKDSQMSDAKYAAMADELAAIYKAAWEKQSGVPSTPPVKEVVNALGKKVFKAVKPVKKKKIYRGGSSSYPV